ncbi:MAG: DUF2281 domain-containing protein [Saprospiraceae bacterium]|nr:DUF2281 domain-containing protein [Saprospiraceae bacterium]
MYEKIHVVMSVLNLYGQFEQLPEELQKQVLDYIEFLLSRHKQAEKPGSKKKKPGKNTPSSRFAGRISSASAAQLHKQLEEMREEWP